MVGETISREEVRSAIEDKLCAHFGVTGAEATDEQIFQATAIVIREIMSRLFLQLVMPEEHRLMVKYLDFANKLINTVPFYLLRCNMDLSAAQTAHDGIFGIE